MAIRKFTPERDSSQGNITHYRTRALCLMCQTRLAEGDSLPLLRPKDWEFGCRNMIKKRLKERNIDYKRLARALYQAGIRRHDGSVITGDSLKNRINRGRFSAVLLMQIYWVLGLSSAEVEEIVGPRQPD